MADDKRDAFSMLAEIYREVGETKTSVENISNKLEKHVDSTQVELKRINELDAEQNRILDKHIEGVNTLKDMYIAHRVESIEQIQLLKESLETQKKDSEARLMALEKPYDLIKFAGKVIVWTATVGGALVGILKALKMLNIIGGL